MDRRAFLAGCAALPLARDALAQSGPLTKIIFPFAAGGSGDMLCRLIAEHLRPMLDRTFVVENRTGGDGLIGIKSVMSAAPDGTTILITTGPTMYLLPMVEAKPSFDYAKDFVPVSLLGRFEFVVVTGPATEAKNFTSWWPGSRQIRASRRLVFRAMAPSRTSPGRGSKRSWAFR